MYETKVKLSNNELIKKEGYALPGLDSDGDT